MCGLVGIASCKPVQEHDWLEAASEALRHRGPDYGDRWQSGDCRVAMAHRRLSIVDLSAGGHQPMRSQCGNITVVTNGEIYNYRELREELIGLGYTFRSESDTEVLLGAYSAWGIDCLSRLSGMFAFVLFDAAKNKLFLARDRAGEKPLFYRITNDELRFASELKALLSDASIPRRIDREALDIYLAMGYVPGDRCILSGFNKLPAAHAMSFDLKSGQSQVWRYWKLPELKATDRDDDELTDELERLLEGAVGRQLVADVPVGVLLSGGVDSSLITAMAVRSSANVQTFSIGFPGSAESDETAHARLIARHFGTQHTELMAEQATAALLPELARQFDEPVIDSSMIPTFLVSKLVRGQCKVALGGDGGDELFGGYGHYRRLLLLQQRTGGMPDSLLRIAGACAEKVLPLGFKGRNWLQGLQSDLANGLPLIASYFDAPSRRRLMAGFGDWPLVAEEEHVRSVPSNRDLLQRSTRMDFSSYLAEDILVKVDRASMLNSLEVRAPFLDHELIEFALHKCLRD